MLKSLVGTIQAMKVERKTDSGYVLQHDAGQVQCPEENMTLNEKIDVFIYTDKAGKPIASTILPEIQIGTYGWGTIQETLPIGAFIDIGTAADVLVPAGDLPTFHAVWPDKGDKLYVYLKKDKQNRLLALPAKEGAFSDIFCSAENVELNEKVSGHVIRPGKEGSVVITGENHRAFIHHTERNAEPRLGELVTGRVIEVKEDGSLNISLLPLKHERMDDDAEKILAYLEANGREMPFGNKTEPDIIRETFGMSKSAFKRALGRLLKMKKIKFLDGKTVLAGSS